MYDIFFGKGDENMSQSNIPNITPNITITRDDAINLLLSSIALEELGLSHIVNAEGEKIQFALGTLPGVTGPGATLAEVMAVNQTVQSTLDTVMKKELLLDSKLKNVIGLVENTGGATGATGPTGATGTGPGVESTGPTGPTVLLGLKGFRANKVIRDHKDRKDFRVSLANKAIEDRLVER